jgi:hypothetical protein
LLILGIVVRLLMGMTLRATSDSVLAVGVLHQIFDASNNNGALGPAGSGPSMHPNHDHLRCETPRSPNLKRHSQCAARSCRDCRLVHGFLGMY